MKKLLPTLLLLMTTAITISAQPHDEDTKYATELLKPGNQVPDIKMKDINGKKFHLVRDFWGTLSPPSSKSRLLTCLIGTRNCSARSAWESGLIFQ